MLCLGNNSPGVVQPSEKTNLDHFHAKRTTFKQHLKLSFLNNDNLNLYHIEKDKFRPSIIVCLANREIQTIQICPACKSDKFRASKFVQYVEETNLDHLNLSCMQKVQI